MLLWAFVLVLIALAAVATRYRPRLMTAMVWSSTAALLPTAWAFRTFASSAFDSGVYLWLIVPSLWAGFQFWAFWARRPYAVAGVQIAISGAAAAALAIS